MKTTLGGISMPRLPPAATAPQPSSMLYLYRFISGRATEAIVAAVAGPDPQIAPKAVQAPTVAMARPPGRAPSQ